MIDDRFDIHNGTADERLAALKRYRESAAYRPVADLGYTNNHIHTFYSFSPYSPCEAVYWAKMAGLSSAGIVDHDTMAGAREFLAAGQTLDLATTVGVECRVNFAGTALAGYRLNSPDQVGMAYMVLHAVPHRQIEAVSEFFAPYRAARNQRNRQMIARLNRLVSSNIDFERDVLSLSKWTEGGAVTERHLMLALVNWLVARWPRGGQLVDYLVNQLQLELSDRLMQRLNDATNPHYDYDLLGALKSSFLPQIYVAASDELPKVNDLIAFAERVDAILAYAYLGDVGESVTGDKPKQCFEDSYLPLLFDTLKKLGIKALSYMPSRNTLQQLKRVQGHCRAYDMLEISGEDVNSPRQSFICEHLKSDDFKHLSETTWHLIEHERK